MNVNIILGFILFVLGAIQLLPTIRRRAAERGLSSSIAIPLTLALIGFVAFMIGIVQESIWSVYAPFTRKSGHCPIKPRPQGY